MGKFIKFIKEHIKTILTILLVLFFGVFVILCFAIDKKNDKIHTLKQENAELVYEMDSLSKVVNHLGSLDAIRVEVTFNLTQKNIASINLGKYENFIKEVSAVTRREIIDSILLKK